MSPCIPLTPENLLFMACILLQMVSLQRLAIVCCDGIFEPGRLFGDRKPALAQIMKKYDSNPLSLATISILGQAPRRS